MFNVKKLIEAIREAVGANRSLVKLVAAKKQELQDLENAPVPRDDVIEDACADVDRMADVGRENFLSLANNTLGRYAHVGRAPLLEARGTAGWESGKVFPENIYFLFREPIKRAIAEEIKAAPWPTNAGPRRSVRVAVIAKLKQEIAELEAEQRELYDNAKQAGVDFAAAPERDGKYIGGQPGGKEAIEKARKKA